MCVCAYHELLTKACSGEILPDVLSFFLRDTLLNECFPMLSERDVLMESHTGSSLHVHDYVFSKIPIKKTHYFIVFWFVLV